MSIVWVEVFMFADDGEKAARGRHGGFEPPPSLISGWGENKSRVMGHHPVLLGVEPMSQP